MRERAYTHQTLWINWGRSKDSFEVIISPRAFLQLDAYIDCIQFTLLNEQAARSVWQDAIDTCNKLKDSSVGQIPAGFARYGHECS